MLISSTPLNLRLHYHVCVCIYGLRSRVALGFQAFTKLRTVRDRTLYKPMFFLKNCVGVLSSGIVVPMIALALVAIGMSAALG